MTGCVYRLWILCALLPGICASWIIHSEPEKWRDAGGTCIKRNQRLLNKFDERLLQGLTSCLEKDNLTFWTGGYTGISLTDWIAFHGCFYASDELFITPNKSQSHTVWSCYHLCGRNMFGLTINSCVCFGNKTLSSETFQKSNDCIHGKEEFMGVNRSIALYKFEADPKEVQNAESQQWCSIYLCNGSSNYYKKNCEETAKYKCDNGFTSNVKVAWDEAVLTCLKNDSFIKGTISNKGCESTSSTPYWSFVRRFREHNYVTRETQWSANIKECEMVHLNRGSISFARTSYCDNDNKQLPYICQSDDGNNAIYDGSLLELCKAQKITEKVTYKFLDRLSSPVSESPSEGTTTMNPETTWTNGGKYKSTSYTRTHVTSDDMNKNQTKSYTTQIFTTQSLVHIKEKSSTPFLNTQDRPSLRYPQTGVNHSGRTVQPTHHTIPETTTHAVHNVVASKKDSRVGLIAGVVAGCVVAVVAVVVILVFCRKASRKKNENAENKNVPPASNPAYDSWLYANTSTNSAKEREVTVDENNSICDIELYDVSGEGDYDHLRSNNRRIKKEVDYMYDTTAQVKAEEEMYSSTRKGNSYVESSDFYDSMQRIKNEGEDLYDHSMTASNYSQTSLYSMAQHCSDPTEF